MNEIVTFIESVEVKDHNGDIEFSAKAGEVVELVATSAQRWISRGKATPGEVKKEPAPAKKKSVKKAAK